VSYTLCIYNETFFSGPTAYRRPTSTEWRRINRTICFCCPSSVFHVCSRIPSALHLAISHTPTHWSRRRRIQAVLWDNFPKITFHLSRRHMYFAHCLIKASWTCGVAICSSAFSLATTSTTWRCALMHTAPTSNMAHEKPLFYATVLDTANYCLLRVNVVFTNSKWYSS